MQKITRHIRKDLEPYINCIMYEECTNPNHLTKIPLYADGYPGIMFQLSENGFYLLPKGKKLSEFFLYGQTLQPISLEAKGKMKFVVFQLYPFASKYLLGVDPKILNDECYDLLQLKHVDVKGYFEQMTEAKTLEEIVELISEVMLKLIQHHKIEPNDEVQKAISIILDNDGAIKINELLNEIYLSERSFERKFKSQVGLTPKQFAKIIQFQKSMQFLNESTFDSLTKIGLESGFSDQSHFIKTFKSYTGQTPSFYLRHSS